MHHCQGKNFLFTRLGPAPVSNRHDTVRRAFNWVRNDICDPYVAQRKKEAASCGSQLNEMSTAYGTFKGDPESS